MYKIYRAGVIRLSDSKYIDNSNHTAWKEYNDWLNQGNLPQPQDPEPQQVKTLEDLKDEKADKLRIKVGQLRGRINASMGGLDGSIFSLLQKQEAASPGQTGRLIAAMARSSGLTPAAIRNLINNKFSDDKLDLAGEIEGTYIKHLTALKGFTTKQEVENYDIDAGWPNVPIPRSINR